MEVLPATAGLPCSSELAMLPPYQGAVSGLDATLEGQLWGQRYKTACFTLNRVTRVPPGSPAGHQKYGEVFGRLKVMLGFFPLSWVYW